MRVEVEVSGAGNPLKSWVRTLNEAEAMTLLDIARPGHRLSLWSQEADHSLTQTDDNYRSLLIKLVERILLDQDGERILDSRYLHHFQTGWPEQRMALFLARYGLAHPWPALAGHKLLLPALKAAENADKEPQITIAAFDAFVEDHIDPSVGASSRKKTRSTIVGLFKKLGVLSSSSTRAPLKIHRTLPSPLAFGWAVASELSEQPRRVVTEQWAAGSSNAAAIFLPPREYAQRCLEAAVSDGLLRRPPLKVGLQLAS